jgi:hypothetical protein
MKNNNSKKKRFGDRFDATLVRDADPLHIIMPYMYKDRVSNEAFINIKIDVTNLKGKLEEFNKDLPKEKHLTYFHCICTALIKTFVLRPYMNRFVQNKKLFQRDDISLSFVIRRQFIDHSQEGLALLKFDNDVNLNDVYNIILSEVFNERSGKQTAGEDSLKLASILPRFVVGAYVNFMNFLDKKGHEPKSIRKGDVDYSSVFLSNIGSLGMGSGYHHLANRGTNSVFALVGKAKYEPQYNEDGTYKMSLMLPIGFTVDERINDGFYCAKSLKVFKNILENYDYLMEKGTASLKEIYQ